MIFPPPFLRKECGAGFIPHKRSAHLFCSARFDFYKCQNKKQKGKKNTTSNHGVSTFLLSGNYRNVQIFNI